MTTGPGRPSRPVRWGVLSTAAINDLILKSVADVDEVQVLAVASRELARAETYAHERGIERAYAGYDALLADPDVEAVYVSLPNALHAEWTVRALEAGKHVLCEKPFALRQHEAQGAVEAARRNGLQLAEAFMYRFHAQTSGVADLVRGGAIGRLRLIRATLTWKASDPAGDVRLSPELDGGALMDVGCYCVSAARLIAGCEPARVHGELIPEPGGVDGVFTGTLRFPGEVVAQFDAALALPLRHRLEVVGTEGWLELTDPWFCQEPSFALHAAGGSEPVAVTRADPYRLQMESFSAAVADGRALPFGVDDIVAQARALEALMESASRARAVDVRSV